MVRLMEQPPRIQTMPTNRMVSLFRKIQPSPVALLAC
jgi:hypothetical protein